VLGWIFQSNQSLYQKSSKVIVINHGNAQKKPQLLYTYDNIKSSITDRMPQGK
jgi:hypothetical protein